MARAGNNWWKKSWKPVTRRFRSLGQRVTKSVDRDLVTLRGNLDAVAEALARIQAAQAHTTSGPLTSCLCTQDRCSGADYAAGCAALGVPLRFNRKQWEWVFISGALREAGMLESGRRGLGFGVGNEPLVSYYAAQGCEILATDLDFERAADSGWTAHAEDGSRYELLNRAGLCPEAEFRERVRYREVDMNAIPTDLEGFDFCWSSCAFEHLGDLEAGLRFFERSMDCLKPGGVAVHTTEFNLSSNEQTVAAANTVLYRRRDIEELIQRLEGAGHSVAPVDWSMGNGVLDRYVDFAPHNDDLLLRIRLKRFVSTSIGLIARRAPDS